MGKLLKYWPLIAGISAMVGGYAVLSYSVNEHHIIDNQRDRELMFQTARNTEDIAVLKNSVNETILNQRTMMNDIKEILRRTK